MNRIHARQRRALSDFSEQTFKERPLPDRLQLDFAAGQIPYPTRHSQRAGLGLDEVPEAHSLNPALNQTMEGRHLFPIARGRFRDAPNG